MRIRDVVGWRDGIAFFMGCVLLSAGGSIFAALGIALLTLAGIAAVERAIQLGGSAAAVAAVTLIVMLLLLLAGAGFRA